MFFCISGHRWVCTCAYKINNIQREEASVGVRSQEWKITISCIIVHFSEKPSIQVSDTFPIYSLSLCLDPLFSSLIILVGRLLPPPLLPSYFKTEYIFFHLYLPLFNSHPPHLFLATFLLCLFLELTLEWNIQANPTGWSFPEFSKH